MRSPHAVRHSSLRYWLVVTMMASLLTLSVVTMSGRGAEAAGATTFRTGAVRSLRYGPQSQQWVHLARPAASGRRPTVIFVHGGGWVGGGVSAWQAESAYWVEHGWVGVNASYRLGSSSDGTAQDGRNMLADMTSVLSLVRSLPYVDRWKIVVVGDSAGGHLAAWMAARHYGKVAGMILWSPVAAPIFTQQTASLWDDSEDCPLVCEQQRSLASRAVKMFGFSARTTNPLTYLSHYGRVPTWVAASRDEWVPYADNGARLCAATADRCSPHLVAGTRHATRLRNANPDLVRSARRWAAKLTRTRAF